MITSLELENFKAFGENTVIPFAPITLIFGENSAGKSSILQALNLLKQTHEGREIGAALLPRSEQGISDLGSFQEMIFDHDLSKTLKINIGFNGKGPFLPSMKSGSMISPNVKIRFSFERKSIKEEVSLKKLEIFTGRKENKLIELTSSAEPNASLFRDALRTVSKERRISYHKISQFNCVWINSDPEMWRECYDKFYKNRNEIVEALIQMKGDDFLDVLNSDSQESAKSIKDHITNEISNSIVFYSKSFSLSDFIKKISTSYYSSLVLAIDGFIPVWINTDIESVIPELHAMKYYSKQTLSSELTIDVVNSVIYYGHELERLLESIFPLGPYRKPSERWYMFSGTNPLDVGYRGELLPDYLLRNPMMLENVNHWLEKLQINYKLIVQPIGGSSSDLFELRLNDTKRKSTVNISLSDVGFGISQILPFIVQSLASKEKIITIEQPEVHIHPRLQSEIGDLIVEAIDKPRNNQFIIETHSEHLVLRIQKLISLGKVKPDDVSIIYVSRGENGSECQRLRLDERGDFIDDWPNGFFPERLNELRF